MEFKKSQVKFYINNKIHNHKKIYNSKNSLIYFLINYSFLLKIYIFFFFFKEILILNYKMRKNKKLKFKKKPKFKKKMKKKR
jgi:hypothetical protein